eukprot:6050677-Alexandrium_andersonii.AAC.1
MSASLVGSEMCIRDRPTVDHGGHRQRLAGHLRPYLGALLGRASGGTCPVSYTHLTLPTICSV